MRKALFTALLSTGLMVAPDIVVAAQVTKTPQKHTSNRRRGSASRRVRNTAVGTAGGAAAGALLGGGRGARTGAVVGGAAGALRPTRRRR